MIGAAEAEDWGDVREAADEVEKIEPARTGWGEYTTACKVQANGAELTYSWRNERGKREGAEGPAPPMFKMEPISVKLPKWLIEG